MLYWEEAAAAALQEIYEKPVQSSSIEQIRSYLDGIISDLWTQRPHDSAEMRISWRRFGAMSRSLGKELNFPIFSGSSDPVHEIVCRKQRDYGHQNISRFGRQGLMVRLHDKVARLENLLSSGRRPNNESIEDNIVDLIGYSCIAMMWEEGTFMLACNTSTVAESTQPTGSVANFLSSGHRIPQL
jgi:hypothetical protein